MINPFDYLFYKIYKAWSIFNSGGYPVRHHAATGFLYTINIWTLYMLIANEFPPDIWAYGSIIFITIIFFVFYGVKRERKILAKYSQESERSYQIGNTVVVFYVIISIIAFILVLRSQNN